MLVDVGLEGRGPIDPVREVADRALTKAGGDHEKAIAAVARSTTVIGGVGGFVTGLGGFVTMPVSLPVNVAEFYLQAVRMVGTIATLRGYDISEPRVRTAVLLTLVGSDVRRGAEEGRDGERRQPRHDVRPQGPAARGADGRQQGGRLPADARREREAARPLRPRHPARRRASSAVASTAS